MDLEDAARLQTARSALELLENLHRGDEASVIETLANADVRSSEAAVASSLKKAEGVASVLDGQSWEVFDAVRRLEDDHQKAAEGNLKDLRDALSKDEYAVGLEAKVLQLHTNAVRLLAPPTPSPPPGRVKVESGQKNGVSLTEAEALVKGLEKKVQKRDKATVDLSWTLYDEK